MSLLHMWTIPYRPHGTVDQHFGLPLTPQDIISAHDATVVAPPFHRGEYYRPWWNKAAAREIGSSIKAHPDKLQIHLDVQHFTPEEITVKTADGFIVVEGKHEEKKDEHGLISRQFLRKYALPEGALPETVESKLSSDGVLTITVPKKLPDAIKGERLVPIAHTGPVRKEIKDLGQDLNTEEDKK